MFRFFKKQALQPAVKKPQTSIALYAQKDSVELVKKVVFSICGENTPIFTIEHGQVNGLTHMMFDVPTSLADKVTVHIILSLPGNRLHGLNQLQ
ncbi:hypothetical protein [Methylophilus sp. TWE2]|uniref:hypothetical protein n=1 Tax=Methylophilus sp. TWE2 TaxID=1662285 RepID=UPI00067089C0|nr:hypothetical protein [Methylophilus sp. TWE2]AKR44237.1 hypothetical protein ACJ67_13070 [Methylophilus sp. TWE2]